MPWHPLIDELDEKLRGEGAIGTTGRGVGPASSTRSAAPASASPTSSTAKLFSACSRSSCRTRTPCSSSSTKPAPLDLETVAAEYHDYGARLAPFVADTSGLVHKALEAGDTVLLEGAQGSLLDLDAGTYEYVTSSVPSSLAAGAAIGMGIGPTQIEKVVGVYKAYMTRVGNGPMPTELLDETGRMLREGGPRPEYGSTTGRPRRCGWFDAVAARYSARIERRLLRGADAPRRARPDASDQGLHRLPRTRPDHGHDAGRKRGNGVQRSRCTRSFRAGRSRRPAFVASKSCPPRPSRTCAIIRMSSARRSASFRWAPSGSRR